jgi:hypothetical protein
MMLTIALALAGTAPTATTEEEPVRREKAIGSRLERRVDINVWDTKETREVQAKFGECVIKKHYAAAQHFVLSPNLDKSEWRKDVARIADGICLAAVTASIGNVEMKFPVDTMRYALAEALVRKEFPAGASSSVTNAAPLEAPKLDESEYVLEPGKKPRKGEVEKLKEGREKQVALIFLAGFGECVVRSEPAHSHALLMTGPTSAEEIAAFKSLMPKFGSCLTAGQSLAFPKATLRGTIAMNYYRLAHAPRVATASAGANK